MPTAVITGASAGFGRALAARLARDGWTLVVDARRPEPLDLVRRDLSPRSQVVALAGDVADRGHRDQLVAAVRDLGGVDLVVNNASELGGSPPPALADLDAGTYEQLWRTNVLAPHQLVRDLLPLLRPGAVLVSLSSDAAVESYPGWGGYGSTKAALDHQTLTWAAEQPQLTWYAVDPGDLRTAMQQAAFPGEDISDRADPDDVAPVLLDLVRSGRPSGRYRLADLTASTTAGAA